MNDSKNLNTVVSVRWDGRKSDCVSLTVERECFRVILHIFHEKMKRTVCILELTSEVGKSHQDTNLWTSFFVSKNFSLISLCSTVCDNRKIVNFQNEVAKSQKYIDSNANYLFKYTKIC